LEALMVIVLAAILAILIGDPDAVDYVVEYWEL
jgi:hypothetical protein